MAKPRRIIKKAAVKTARGIGYNRPQARTYAKAAVKAIKPAGVTQTSKTYRKQIAGQMTQKQKRVVRKYDKTG